MQDSKISHSDRQVSVGSLDHVEHNTISRTIHRFETMLFVVILNEEDVFTVLEVMSTRFPELRAVDVWRKDFTVTSDSILGTHQLYESVVNDRPMREEKSTSR